MIDAYGLPKEPESEAERRRQRIQGALAAAADVPRRTAAAATEILELVESCVPHGNMNVVSDAAAAAGAARAGLQTALLNIDANRALIEDPAARRGDWPSSQPGSSSSSPAPTGSSRRPGGPG